MELFLSAYWLGIAALIGLAILWPFYSVPTGSRGVVTQFGKIVGIEGEGLAVLPPWQKLSNFSIRAETAIMGGVIRQDLASGWIP